MKKILLILLCIVLVACDNEPQEQQYILVAPDGRQVVVSGTHEPTESEKQNIFTTIQQQEVRSLAEKQNTIEKKYLTSCYSRFDAQTSIIYPLAYRNNVCICFAEKVSNFIFSGPEKDVEKFTSFDLYKTKKLEQFFGECTTQNQKYKSF